MDPRTVSDSEPHLAPADIAPADWEPLKAPPPILLYRPPPKRVSRVAGALQAASGWDLGAWMPDVDWSVPEASGDGRLVEVLTWIVVAICLAIWAVVGAVLWVPLTGRAVVLFSLLHLQGMLDGERADAGVLHDALTFYRRGFEGALEVARRTDARGATSFGSQEPLPLARLARVTGWTLLFWYATLAVIGVVASPVELWDALGSWSWQEWPTDALDRAAASAQGLADGGAARSAGVASVPR